MLFYIDYLDHITSGSKLFSFLEQRLRFDLLVYGREKLCMSVPACVKMADTTKLLQKLDAFWLSGIIQLQLDKKHKGNAANYFRNRKRVLSNAMPEEKLINHFEFVAYEDARTDRFFRITFLTKRMVLKTHYLSIKHKIPMRCSDLVLSIY